MQGRMSGDVAWAYGLYNNDYKINTVRCYTVFCPFLC
jgi:hypothetical protein